MIEFLQANFKAITAGILLVVFLSWETISPFHAFFRKGDGGRRLRHGLTNFALGVVNGLVIAFVFAALWVGAAEFAEEFGIGVVHWLSLSGWLAAVVAILLLDCWTYWWHRLNHIVPFLWRFHKVHHADVQMDVTTANRFHLGEIVMSSCLRVLVILLVGADFWHVVLYEAILLPVVQFHHANIGLRDSWDRALRVFIPTPVMHKIHHSRLMSETNSNYTSLLSIWDRLFGSFNLGRPAREVELGLDGLDSERQQRIDGLLAMPFRSTRQSSDDS